MPAPTGVDIYLYVSNNVINFVDTALKVYRTGDNLVAERERQLAVATFVSAESELDGKKISMMFSKNMKVSNTDDVKQFKVTVKKSDVAGAAKDLELSDNVNDFKLKANQDSAIEIAFKDPIRIFENDVVEVSYTKNSDDTKNVKDYENNKIENFSQQTVVNKVLGPKIKSAKTAPNGLKIILEFDKKMKDPTALATTEWKKIKIEAKKGAGTTNIFGKSAKLRSGYERTLELEIDKKIDLDQTVTLQYELPDNPITKGIYADDDTIFWAVKKPIKVANEAVEPPKITNTETTTDGLYINLKFDKPMEDPSTATSTEWEKLVIKAKDGANNIEIKFETPPALPAYALPTSFIG